MNVRVQMTLIICVTLTTIIWIAAKYGSESNNDKKK